MVAMANFELGKRALRDDLGTVDGHPGTTRGGNIVIDAIEGRVALVHPLRALGSAFRKLLAARDVVGQLRAKLGGPPA